MRDFFEKLLIDDETGQKFTKKEILIYGILVPLTFVAIMCIAGWLDLTYNI